MQGLEYVGGEGGLVAFRRVPGAALDRTVVYLQTGTIPFEMIEADEAGRRIVRGLRQLGTVGVFDRRGIGMSDPLPGGSAQTAWAEDLVAVMQAAADGPVVIFAQQFMDFVLDAVAARPDLVEAVVWYEPTTDWKNPESPDEIHDLLNASVEGEADFLSVVCPTRSSDRSFREWFDDAGARGASPSVAKQLYARASPARAQELQDLASSLVTPVLIVRRPGSLTGVRKVLPDDSLFANAEVVEVAGRDWHIHGEEVEAVMNAAGDFILGRSGSSLVPPERALAAILFTDIVGSTAAATEMGDTAWKRLISHHDAIVATEAASLGGQMVKSTGDGSIAMLPSASSAIVLFRRVRARVAAEGLEIRAGIHAGDVDRRGEDVSGLTVTAAARIMDRAGPSQLLVSGSLVTSLLGSKDEFRRFETVELKGLPGSWTLHEWVEPSDRP